MEPVFASVIAWIWLGQVLTGWQVVGGVVVLAGIGLAQTARRTTPAAQPDLPVTLPA
jgi:drug/metabolite transporter (DMT)-like permease